MFLLTNILLPFFFVIIMNAMESLVDNMTWPTKLTKVGWDTCVLAMGVTGGIFSDAVIVNAYKPQGAIVIGLFSVGISLLMAILIALLRKRNPVAGWKALAALALGGCALGLPTYEAFARYSGG